MKGKSVWMQKCERSLVFQVIAVARWVALILLMGIGLTAIWLQYQNQQDIGWLFFVVCIMGGGVLFWMGTCLLKSECMAQQRAKRQPRSPSS